VELLPLIDYVMVMTVNPGFAGQKYLEFVNPKIEKLVKLAEDFNFEILVDGAISPEKIQQLNGIGVTGFVLGTSALFGKKDRYDEILNKLRNETVEA
jgi:ribulose-phosphate 3-epimerase